MKTMYLVAAFAPLLGAIAAGFFGRGLGRLASALITIGLVGVSTVASLMTLIDVLDGNHFNGTLYQWAQVGAIRFEIGFMIDPITAMMMVVVTSVSLCVHVYTMGYMEEDPGYQRFFAYISLFTFAMLMLVMSNNFLQLFFGWEAVGLVSYLLIGFWYTRPTAIFANLKAFLVNRVGDFGFALGIGLLLHATGSLDYVEVFERLPALAASTIEVIPGQAWGLLTLAAILVFVGAMGKSAQFPLHVWLPDSMEGPTPISALIHAATMVTAGIFMVARMSPLFELSDTALSVVIVIGAITSLSMGLMGLVQYDIKRVVAYSTLSQLGLMTIALGASAYQAAIFHLMTHAFFKALLFLAAGSVIIGMHHNQDLRHMGGLAAKMPVTWITCLLATLSAVGTPLFSGFYSKDSIIEAVGHATVAGAGFAHFVVVIGVLITSLYSWRMYFMTFHGEPRWHLAQHNDHASHDQAQHNASAQKHHAPLVPHESPAVVTVPLVLLAIPSVMVGAYTIEAMVVGDFFKSSIMVLPNHPAITTFAGSFHGVFGMALHAFFTLPFWLMLLGFVLAWAGTLYSPQSGARLRASLRPLVSILEHKYYLDDFNEKVLAAAARGLGRGLWKGGDQAIIDGVAINGSARTIGWLAGFVRHLQSGFIYDYAIAMIGGVAILLYWFVPILGG
ncbi:MAG: NADH-quinone oxidoreductase subunit L [Betaproteobacteria bacterium]|nr:NADH-quinone oxidoreductase subunit L [Betaproteobacteria bacterium]